MAKLTIEMLPTLVERTLLSYSSDKNPLHDIRKEFGVDTHFEYDNGSNIFFMNNNPFRVIQETINCSDNTLFVFLKKDLVEDLSQLEDWDDEIDGEWEHRHKMYDYEYSVTIYYNGSCAWGTADYIQQFSPKFWFQ